MAVLNTKKRDALASSSFALPGRRYPINDISHGRAALRMDHNATPAERAVIERKVHNKFPSIGKKKAPMGWAP